MSKKFGFEESLKAFTQNAISEGVGKIAEEWAEQKFGKEAGKKTRIQVQENLMKGQHNIDIDIGEELRSFPETVEEWLRLPELQPISERGGVAYSVEKFQYYLASREECEKASLSISENHWTFINSETYRLCVMTAWKKDGKSSSNLYKLTPEYDDWADAYHPERNPCQDFPLEYGFKEC